jgi:Flp pilus assembly protein TadG
VEFAIVAPLFVSLLFGAIEFGLIIYTQGMLAHASREGARFGVIYATPRRTQSEIQAVVQNYLNKVNLTSTATVTVTGAGGASGAPLSVGIDYTYQFFVLPKDINNLLGGKMANLNLAANAVMLME